MHFCNSYELQLFPVWIGVDIVDNGTCVYLLISCISNETIHSREVTQVFSVLQRKVDLKHDSGYRVRDSHVEK